jgi:hypothetical protein
MIYPKITQRNFNLSHNLASVTSSHLPNPFSSIKPHLSNLPLFTSKFYQTSLTSSHLQILGSHKWRHLTRCPSFGSHKNRDMQYVESSVPWNHAEYLWTSCRSHGEKKIVRRRIKATANVVQLISREIFHQPRWEFVCCSCTQPDRHFAGRHSNSLYLCCVSIIVYSWNCFFSYVNELTLRLSCLSTTFHGSSMQWLEFFMLMSVPFFVFRGPIFQLKD